MDKKQELMAAFAAMDERSKEETLKFAKEMARRYPLVVVPFLKIVVSNPGK